MSQGSRRETLRQQIDENLRRVYQQKIEEGIPDRFEELLRQLKGDGEEASSGGGAVPGPASTRPMKDGRE